MEAEIFLAATLVVIAGSVIQSVSGVGGGFLIVPLLAWIDLQLVPAPMLFASLSLSGLMWWLERRAINYRHVTTILLTMLPGALAGAWLVSRVPVDSLGLVFGSVILLAILISASGLRLPLTRGTGLAAGALAGAMGASTGIGAPVVAVLFQDQTGAVVRSTLALIYTIATLLILSALLLFGRFGTGDILSGLLLVPGFLLGSLIGRRLQRRVDTAGWTRTAVLVVSGLAAVGLIVRSL